MWHGVNESVTPVQSREQLTPRLINAMRPIKTRIQLPDRSLFVKVLANSFVVNTDETQQVRDLYFNDASKSALLRKW